MKTIRILLLTLCVSLVAVLCVACGTTKQTESTRPTGGQQQPAETEENKHTEHTYDENAECTVCHSVHPSVAQMTFSPIADRYYMVDTYTGSDNEVMIPKTYQGKPVMGIGDGAFANVHSIRVTIPDSIRHMLGSPWSRSVEEIHYTGDVASWCGISFEYSDSNPLFSSYGARISKLFINGQEATEINIPDTVTEIKDYAFGGWNGTTLIIPDSVTTIGDSAFFRCIALTSVTIGNGVTSIGESCFNGCIELRTITIGSGVEQIGGFAFGEYNDMYCCRNLKSVYYTGDIASWCGITFGTTSNPLYYADNLYINNELVKEIVIPDTITEIKDYAFLGWNGTSVTIPDCVTSIGYEAFYGCSGLTSITIGSGVTSVGGGAFWRCDKLVEVYNRSSLQITAGSEDNGYVGYYAKNVYNEENGSKLFTDANGYILYTDVEDVSLIGYTGDATELTLPDGITVVNQYAFNDYSSLTSVTIPDSVTSIGNWAFWCCTGLTSITIGNGVTSIGNYAFSNCIGLTSITIPDSVTDIGEAAFGGCTGLTSITYQGTKAQWNAIGKGDFWDDYTGIYIVLCTDGEIIK